MHRINNYKKHNSKAVTEKGITLIALIITIVLMLILATVVVTGAINGGLFGYAKKAKDNTEIASEKEGIEKSYIIAQGTSKYGTVSETEFQKALDKVMGEGQAEVMANGDGFVVKIGERYYEIDKKGKISDTIEYARDKTLAEYIAEITHEDEEPAITLTYEVTGDVITVTAMKNENLTDEEWIDKMLKNSGTVSEKVKAREFYYILVSKDWWYYLPDQQKNISSLPNSIENMVSSEELMESNATGFYDYHYKGLVALKRY